jgi:peroxiredoxin
MKSRWAIAALGAVGLALISLPLVSTRLANSRDSGATAPAARETPGAEDASGVCDASPKPAAFDFTLKDMDGKSVDLAGYKGRPVLLNFWATWCGPCKFEIPMFVALQEKYRDSGFVVLGVSVDDPAPALKTFAAEYKMNYPVLMGDDAIQDAYGPIFAIPVTFMIKKDGTICRRHFGPATEEEFDREVRALF